MKKLSAILLLSVYALTQIGSIAWYYYKPIAHAYFSHLQQLRNTSGKQGSDLISIFIDKNRFAELKRENKEIVFDGFLYDIKETVIENDIVHLLLKKDKAETKWTNHYQSISNLLNKHSNSKSPGTVKTSAIFLVLYHPNESKINFGLLTEIQLKHIAVSTNQYSSPIISLLSPPPKVA
ncbi:MAG: hypothetical protein ACM3H8_14440 [Sphingobacteriales bacterium]